MEYILNFPIIFDYLKEIEEEYKKIVNYIDVTKQWIQDAKPNSHTIKDLNYWESNGNKYYVDGKNVVLDYSKSEKKCAEWLENTLGGEIYMCPRVNKPDGIKTPDYLFRNNKFDLKQISTKGKRVFDNRLNNLQKNQSENIIFDISSNPMNDDEIINQIDKIYNSKSRNWLNVVILIRDSKLLKVFQRNRD